MLRFSHRVATGLAILALAACGAPSAPSPAAPPPAAGPRDQLSRIVERYWDERVSEDISPQAMADSLARERRALAELLTVARDPLEPGAKLTYDIFKRQRELAIEGFTYPSELLPINMLGGIAERLESAAVDTAQRPWSAADYENWLQRIDVYVRWTQQAIVNMRDGIRRGYVSPRILVEHMLPRLERLGEDNSTNVFYAPLRTMPAGIAEPERTRLTAHLNRAVKEQLLPANRALHEFLQRVYLQRARAGVALSDLPLGQSWYAFRVKRATGAVLGPAEIYSIGTAEVERLHARLQALHPTPAPAENYPAVAARVAAALPSIFAAQSADFAIPETAPPGADGTTMADFLEQVAPGRHYQLAIQEQRTDLPRFRRLSPERGFTEGWGLYAASLGEELALYNDEESKTQELTAQMRCAVALVVDTGLQIKGWTRAQALDYFHAQMPMDEVSANALADEYTARPGSALACMMGYLKIQSLRMRAQQAQGSRFDLREFHRAILQDGAMPLDILESKMQLWMETPR